MRFVQMRLVVIPEISLSRLNKRDSCLKMGWVEWTIITKKFAVEMGGASEERFRRQGAVCTNNFGLKIQRGAVLLSMH